MWIAVEALMCKAPYIYWNYYFSTWFKTITSFMYPLCTNIYTYGCV